MKSAKKLREEIAGLMKRLGDMRALCTSENRDPSKEERDTAEQYLNDIDGLEELLALEMRSRSTIDRMKEPETEPEKTPIDTRKDKQTRDRRDHFASSGEFFQAEHFFVIAVE